MRFVIGCEQTREGVLIDPGDEVEQLLAAAARHQLSIGKILTFAFRASSCMRRPAMTIGSLETALSQEDCIAKGTSVMKGAGLTKNFEVVGRTIYGETDNYTGAIRCESGKAIVLFVVAGPESKNTTEIQAKLKAAFDAK